MLAPADVSALILAGGRATRLGGIDKRLIVVDGRTIFERQVAVLAARVAEILVAASSPVEGHRTVADVIPSAGPLAGIAAGLAAVTTPWMLVLAGDMPHVDRALIERLLGAADPEIEAVGIRREGLPEPLCCLLRVAPARAHLDALLLAQRFKASGLLAGLATRWIDDVDPAVLRNINTPGDLR